MIKKILIGLILLMSINNASAWLDEDYLYRKTITLTGNTSGAQTDYQILLNVTYDSDMQTDFDDLRFANDTHFIDAWLESKVDSSYALVWVEFPTTPANTIEQDYYMYYGNAGAASDWDGTNTFLAFIGDSVYTGMTKLNTDEADIFDMTTNPGFLTINPTTNDTRFYYGDFQSPFIYKNVDGDFLAETKLTSNRDANYEADALIVGDFLLTTKNWFGLLFKYDGSNGGRTKQASNTVDSVTTPINSVFDYAEGYMRITKLGTTYTSYYKQAAGDSWTSVDSKSRTFATVNVGVGSSPDNTAGNIVSKFYYFIVRKYAENPATYEFGDEEHYFYTPPTPTNLQNTSGNYWVNYTWSAGSGNVTDSYNVSFNETWHNTTTNLYFNQSIAADSWGNISVWAYNNTNFGSLSDSYIHDEIYVEPPPPVNVPTPTNLENTTGANWINYTWSAGTGNITDSYNVSFNDIWYNTSSITYFYKSLQPCTWGNISVWAYNNTLGLSGNSANDTTQIDCNPPGEAPDEISDYKLKDHEIKAFFIPLLYLLFVLMVIGGIMGAVNK